MTVGSLIKILEKMPPRTPVTVDVDSFKKLIDEWNLIHIVGCEYQIIEKTDDDGGFKFRKDGTAATMQVCVISGGHDPLPDLIRDFECCKPKETL